MQKIRIIRVYWGFLVILAAFTLGMYPRTLGAQNVEKDSTEWVGEWRDEGVLHYGYRLKLTPLGEGRMSGVFEWKLLWTSLPDHMAKVGAVAKEYVVGRYDLATRRLDLIGIRQEDPTDIISMDHYLLDVSNDNRSLKGINVKPTNYHGSMFGVYLEPKPKKAIAATKTQQAKSVAVKASPSPSPSPTAKPKPTAPNPTPAKPSGAGLAGANPAAGQAPAATSANSAAKEIAEREIVTKTELTSSSAQVKISIFDESLIDGDVISLSWNGVWILRYYRVVRLPKEIVLDLQMGENTLVMFAENLGRYPPNTAAFSVQRGSKKEQFILNSDMGKSEAIKLIRQ